MQMCVFLGLCLQTLLTPNSPVASLGAAPRRTSRLELEKILIVTWLRKIPTIQDMEPTKYMDLTGNIWI